MVTRHRRVQEEGDLKGRDVGLIGERQEKDHGYENPMWECVDRMVEGDYPTTNLGTVAAASKHASGHPHKHEYNKGGYVHRERDRMRENMEEHGHAKKGGHMKHKKHYSTGGSVPGSNPLKVSGHHPHHRKEMDVSEPGHKATGPAMRKGGHAHKKHHYAAGGVGKVRKGMY